jgi:hypothetical protein
MSDLLSCLKNQLQPLKSELPTGSLVCLSIDERSNELVLTITTDTSPASRIVRSFGLVELFGASQKTIESEYPVTTLPPALQDFERFFSSRSEDEHQRALGRLGIHTMLLQAIAMLGNGEELDVSSEFSSQCSFHNKYKRLDLFVYLTSPAWHFSGHEGRQMLYLRLGLPKQGVAKLKAAFRTESKKYQFGTDTAKS